MSEKLYASAEESNDLSGYHMIAEEPFTMRSL